jgi:hypothetical protein
MVKIGYTYVKNRHIQVKISWNSGQQCVNSLVVEGVYWN